MKPLRFQLFFFLILFQTVYGQENSKRKVFSFRLSPNFSYYNNSSIINPYALNFEYYNKNNTSFDLGISILRQKSSNTYPDANSYYEKNITTFINEFGYKFYLSNKKKGIYYKPSLVVKWVNGTYNSFSKYVKYELIYEAKFYPYFGVGQTAGIQYDIYKNFFIDYNIGLVLSREVTFSNYTMDSKWLATPFINLGFGLKF